MTKTNANECTAVVLYKVQSPIAEFLKEEKLVTIGSESVGFHEIKIQQDWDKHGVAGVIWDAAIVLSNYLLKNSEIVSGKHVLELGAGTGLVSITSALAGAKQVITTDLPGALPVLERNINSNSIPTNPISIRPLIWGKTQNFTEQFDVILGSDLVYDESLFDDLTSTLNQFASISTQIYISARIRYTKDKRFFKKLSDIFKVEKVIYDNESHVVIYKITR